jgi:hypothetical protein
VKTILAWEIETLALPPKRKSGKRESGKARNGKMNSGASLDDGDVVNSFAGADLNGIVPAQEREASALVDNGGTHAKARRREGTEIGGDGTFGKIFGNC